MKSSVQCRNYPRQQSQGTPLTDANVDLLRPTTVPLAELIEAHTRDTYNTRDRFLGGRTDAPVVRDPPVGRQPRREGAYRCDHCPRVFDTAHDRK